MIMNTIQQSTNHAEQFFVVKISPLQITMAERQARKCLLQWSASEFSNLFLNI